MKRQLGPAAALIFVTAALVGCSAAGSTATIRPTAPPAGTPKPAATPLPVVTMPAALQGNWKTEVHGGFVVSSGVWGLRIAANDMYLANPSAASGDEFPIGVIDVTDTTMTFKSDDECPTEGHYTYALTGGTLKFTVVSDSCSGRYSVLAAGPWQK